MAPEIIPEDHFLFKRIPPIHWVFEEDRLSSAAFRTSALVQCVNWEKYSSEQHTLEGFPSNTGLLKIQAKVPIERDLEVKHVPVEDIADPTKNNPAHSEILGSNLNKDSHCKNLSRNSIVLKKPT